MLNFARMQKKVRALPSRYSQVLGAKQLTMHGEQNFELNPHHPLVERLLEKVDEAGEDEDALAELKDSVSVLWYAPTNCTLEDCR